MTRKRANKGFTLLELLIATAIFALLMSAIAALFLASLHAVRAGYQSQEAFETGRGAFNVVETDLSTVFTSRDLGQYYQFYGNEYGMTMVGLIRSRDLNGREFTQLGRITYVIYPVVLRGTDGQHYVTAPFAQEYARNVGISSSGAPTGFYKTRGVRYMRGNEDDPEGELCVAALIRLVEPGVQDLDSYPFDWDEIIDRYDLEIPGMGVGMRAQLDEALETSPEESQYLPADSSNKDYLARAANSPQQMLAAAKRDMWIRMLSCQEYWIPQLNGDLPVLPNIWLEDVSVDDTPVNPRDYILAENVGVATPNSQASRYPLRAYRPFPDNNAYKPYPAFFEYGRVSGDSVPELMPAWNANFFGYIDPLRVGDSIDDDRNGQIFISDRIDNDLDGLVDEPDEFGIGTIDPAERVVTPRFDDVNDISDVHPARPWEAPLDIPADVPYGTPIWNNLAYGSPLLPRLPEVVMVRIPMVFPAPYLGAGHFERKMEQLIDVPAAYTRSQLASTGP